MSRTLSRVIGHGLAALAVLGGLACASQKPSGFLQGDFRQLRDGRLIYVHPDHDLSVYDKLIIDPVLVYLDQDTGQAAPVEELARMARQLHQALIDEVNPTYPVVEDPGPNVLRLRSAITHVVLRRPLVLREVGIEAELLDSVTGEREVAVISRQVGPTRVSFRNWALALRRRLDEARRGEIDWQKLPAPR